MELVIVLGQTPRSLSLYDEELAGPRPPPSSGIFFGAGSGQRALFCKLCLKLFLMTSSFFGIGTGGKKSWLKTASLQHEKYGGAEGVAGRAFSMRTLCVTVFQPRC